MHSIKSASKLKLLKKSQICWVWYLIYVNLVGPPVHLLNFWVECFTSLPSTANAETYISAVIIIYCYY